MNKSLRLATVAPEHPPAAASDDAKIGTHVSYAQDAFERWILFLDTLGERADNMIAHERQGMPLYWISITNCCWTHATLSGRPTTRCSGSRGSATIAGTIAWTRPSRP